MTITDSVNFAIKGSGCSGTTLACSSVEELRDLDWDELVGLKTAYLQSGNYYRNKQLVEAATGGGGVK